MLHDANSALNLNPRKTPFNSKGIPVTSEGSGLGNHSHKSP